MNKSILIRKPEIKNIDSVFFAKASRLSAVIDYIDENEHPISSKECYFDFSSDYEKYIEIERSDAFVIGLLSFAMESGYDIKFETPISRRLYYQLSNYYIPMISRFNEKYPMHNIALNGPVIDIKVENEGAVATGCSGGVDSFYTIVKYGNPDAAGKNLTHLICSSSGTLDHNVERINKSFYKIFEYVKSIGKDAGLPVVGCYNNLYEFYNYPYKAFNTFFTTTFCAVPLALDKLFSVYYVNSGIPVESFSLDITSKPGNDCSVFDFYTVQQLCTDSLTFYSSGFETTSRNEKIAFIADNPLVQKYLAVCGAEMDGADIPPDILNCSRCKKCLRTMFSLYAINKLDFFSNTFNISDFKNHLGKRLGSVLAYDHKEFNDVSLKMAKDNNIRIPASALYYKNFVFVPLEFCRKVFRRFPLIKEIGYKLNIDSFMHGYRRGKNY